MHTMHPTEAAGAVISVQAVASIMRNAYAPHVEQAQAALDAGRPAFWLTSQYHDQIGWGFLPHANREGGLAAAERAYEVYWGTFDMDVALLDRLVPLNEAAVLDLADAYEIAGTFRTAAELAKRCPGLTVSRPRGGAAARRAVARELGVA